MRSPVRLLQNIWFCDVKETNDGVDLMKTYSKPLKRRFRVSATMGYVRGSAIGWNLLYDRYVDCYDRNFKPPEGTMCFVDIIPVLDKDGNLAMKDVPEYELDGTPILDDDGNQVTHKEYITEPDYIIKRILNTQKGIVARFVLSRA